jgi:putative OPT family oligopeptide transporter
MGKQTTQAAGSDPKEFTLKALVLGLVLALIFGVGNAYLGLKVGMTVSASIPAAVVSMSLLRLLFRSVSIQENNIVQSMASAGEAVAAGAIMTIPAFVLIGEPLDPWRASWISLLGGFLGLLLMVPLRHLMIVEEQAVLPYPEGKACAEILRAGESGARQAVLAFVGTGLGVLYRLGSGWWRLWPETLRWSWRVPFSSELAIDGTPALLGVGYILGPAAALTMWAGGLMAWLVILPLIHYFGLSAEVVPPAQEALNSLVPQALWSAYVRYIGAGCVAVGGVVALIRIIPMLARTVRQGLAALRHPHGKPPRERTERDLPGLWVAGGIGVVMGALTTLEVGFVPLLLLLLAAFLFVAVTCITTGLVGSSSNPVSSMTITTLLAICGIFLALGWTDRYYLISALTISAVLTTALAMAGDTAQDLKTGYLVGATPAKQQISLLIGVILPALSMGSVLALLNTSYTFGSEALPAPQATLIALIAQGVLEQTLPLGLVSIGVCLGLVLVALRVNVLAAALGIYLPIQLSTAVMLGGLIRWFCGTASQKEDRPGTLLASGLVAGDSLTGIAIAAAMGAGLLSAQGEGPVWLGVLALAFLTILIIGLVRRANRECNS